MYAHVLFLCICAGLATRKCSNGIWEDPDVNDCESAIFGDVRIKVSQCAYVHVLPVCMSNTEHANVMNLLDLY